MRPKRIVAVALIVIGIVALTVLGIRYATRGGILDIGRVRGTTERTQTTPVAPIGGAIVLAGGLMLLLLDKKSLSRT